MRKKHTKEENVKIQVTNNKFVIWFENGDCIRAVSETEAWEQIEDEEGKEPE